MGFIRHQQERLAFRYLVWLYQRRGQPVPSDAELRLRAAGIIDEAHCIARKRGRNVITILKEMIDDIKKE